MPKILALAVLLFSVCGCNVVTTNTLVESSEVLPGQTLNVGCKTWYANIIGKQDYKHTLLVTNESTKDTILEKENEVSLSMGLDMFTSDSIETVYPLTVTHEGKYLVSCEIENGYFIRSFRSYGSFVVLSLPNSETLSLDQETQTHPN